MREIILKPQNIFIAISKYPYNPEHNPRENQHTAFFAYLLNKDKKLLKYLMTKLLFKKSKLLESIQHEDFDEVVIQESETLDGQKKFPDMKIRTRDGKLTIYVENKIDSVEGKFLHKGEEGSQLTDYLKLAKINPSVENFVLYITKNHELLSKKTEEDPHFAGKFSWRCISEIIKEYVEPSTDSNNIIIEFLKYLEEFDMTGSKGFKQEYACIWKTFNEFVKSKDDFLENIEIIFKNEGYIISKENDIDWFLRTIHKPKWNNIKWDGFWIDIGFYLDFNVDTEQDYVYLITELGISKKFYDHIKNNFKIQLEKAINDLKDNFNHVEEDDQILFKDYITLTEITDDYTLSKDKQMTEITNRIKSAVNTLEMSGLITLLEKNR